jgi:hypothetical protein
MNNGTVIIGGYIGIFNSGGVTWDYIQYVLGFKKLGFRVVYVEDTMMYPVYGSGEESWKDSQKIVNNLSKIMKSYGLENDWIYIDEVTAVSYGMKKVDFIQACKDAEWFVNVSCSTVMREEYLKIPYRILIDSDPMFTQVQMLTKQSFTEGESDLMKTAKQHNFHFTFGENISSKDCLIPDTGINWKTTRQPVVLDFWTGKPPNKQSAFTTLMNWSAGSPLMYDGESWGQKDKEFLKISSVPSLFETEKFSMVVNKTGGGLTEEDETFFSENQWEIQKPEEFAATANLYRSYIQKSKAELSVAKETYVKANTGWFSCRSACYLAAGRPVIAQDTGWSKNYVSGIGLFAFSNIDQASEALELVNGDYKNQCEAAKNIANSYFDSNKVISNLLNDLS